MAKKDTSPCKHGLDIDIGSCWHCLAEQYGAGVADDIIERDRSCHEEDQDTRASDQATDALL